jgi:hypothetical protein
MIDKKEKTAPCYVETIVIAMLAAGMAVFGYHIYFAPPQIKTFDLKGYLREQTALIQAGEMTEEQFKEKLNRMEAALDGEKGMVILKDVVIRNGIEIPAK